MIRKLVFAWLTRHNMAAVDAAALAGLDLSIRSLEVRVAASGALSEGATRHGPRPRVVRDMDRECRRLRGVLDTMRLTA